MPVARIERDRSLPIKSSDRTCGCNGMSQVLEGAVRVQYVSFHVELSAALGDLNQPVTNDHFKGSVPRQGMTALGPGEFTEAFYASLIRARRLLRFSISASNPRLRTNVWKLRL